MTKQKVNDRGQITFASPSALLAAFDTSSCYDNKTWIGEARETYLRRTVSGDNSKVARAEKLLDQIEAQVDRDHATWQNAVVGAYPDVPAFLANNPDNMRRRVLTEDERSPIRVWVDVVSSAGITWQQLEPRGVAALALVMQLIRCGRAVELYTFTSLHGRIGGETVICVKLPTQPIDISVVAYCLTSQGFSRGVTYEARRQLNNFNGAWGKNYRHSGTLAQRVEGARQTLHGLAQPQDIILPSPYTTDINGSGDNSLLFRDPVQWVKTMCDQANGALA